MGRLRQAILQLGLTAVYLFIATPIAWVLKLRGRSILEDRMDPSRPTYWVSRPVDSSDRQVYDVTSGQADGHEARALIHAYRKLIAGTPRHQQWRLLPLLLLLAPLASAPSEGDIRSDLYVLF